MLETILTPETLDEQLKSFTGSLISHPYNGSLLLSEGVHWLARNVELRGMLGFITAARRLKRVKAEAFQVFTLVVNRKARLAYVKVYDSDGVPLHGENLPYGNFPLAELTIWVIDGVAMLPGEYDY